MRRFGREPGTHSIIIIPAVAHKIYVRKTTVLENKAGCCFQHIYFLRDVGRTLFSPFMSTR